MKRVARQFRQWLLGSSSVIVLVVPTLAMGAWTYAYFASAYATNLSGIALDFTYDAPGGRYRVSADSVSVDLESKVVTGFGVRLRDAKGQTVVRTRKLRVRQLPGGALDMYANDLAGTLARLPSGKFNVELLIPAGPEGGPENAFSLRANEARLTYRDLNDPKGPSLPLKLQAITATGIGDDVRLTGLFSTVGLTRTPIDLSLTGGRFIDLQTTLAGADPRALLRAAQPLLPKELKQLNWDELDLTGKLRVITETSGEAHVFGDIAVASKGFSYAEWLNKRTLKGDLKLEGKRVSGPVQIVGPGVDLQSQVTFDWAADLTVVGSGRLSLASLNALEPAYRKGLPRDLTFTAGTFKGDFGYRASAWWAKGLTTAQSLRGNRLAVSGLTAQVHIQPDWVTFDQAQATFKDIALTGKGQLNTRANSLTALVRTEGVDLRQLREYGLPKELMGTGSAEALINGQLSNPNFTVRSEGNARIASKDLTRPISGKYQVLVSGTRDNVLIQRAIIDGKDGGVTVSGTLSPAQNTAKLEFRGAQVPLSLIRKDATGTGYIVGQVSGKLNNPNVTFETQIVQAGQGDTRVPILLANGTYKDGKLEVNDLLAQSGFSAAKGKILWDSKTDKLSGTFSSDGVQLADWDLGPVVGNLAIKGGVLGGTLAKPTFRADVESDEIWLQGTAAQNFKATLSGNSDEITLQGVQTRVNYLEQSGSVTLNGKYRPGTKAGEFALAWTGVPLGALPVGGADYAMAGSTDGQGTLRLADGKISGGTAEVALSQVAVNAEEYGNGSVTVQMKGDTATLKGALGNLDRYLLLENAEHDLGTGVGNAKLTAFNVRLEKVTRLAQPQMRAMDPEARRFVADLGGNLGGTADLAWRKEEFDFSIPDGTLEELLLGDTRAGALQFSARKAGKDVTMEKLLWEAAIGGADESVTKLEATARLKADGTLTGDGELSHFPLSFIAAVRPEIVPIAAKLDSASFSLSGTQDEPVVQGSARVVAQLRDSSTLATPPSVDLFALLLDRKGLTAEGQFQAAGFTGPLQASLPFASLDPGATEEFSLTAKAQPRGLIDFRDALPSLDGDRSTGTVEAELSVRGTADDWRMAGVASLNAEQITLRNTRTKLTGTALTLRLSEKEVGFEMSATSSEGGTLLASATAPIELDFERTLEEWFSATTVTGSILTDRFVVDEGDLRSGDQIAMTLGSSRVDITGTLASPLLKGTVLLQGLAADLPPFAPSTEPTRDLVSNPRFDLTFRAPRPATVRSLNSSFQLSGEGRLTGSFLAPNVDTTLNLRGGVLRLPNARVQLEEGGRVEVAVRTAPDGTSQVRVPVNLIGRTSVTARRPGNRFERYDLTLLLSGDLTDPENGLSITGSSDPGDLTQQEILAIVGQRDLVESLASLASNTRNNEVQNLLLSVALPSLIDPVTQTLADLLNLDTIALEYNPFEGPTLIAAKSLGRNFTIYARRVIPVASTLQERTELKLIYRIPGRDPFLSRSRLVLANESGRGWRIGFEYFYRF